MQLVVKGKNMDVPETLKRFVVSKVTSRLERVLPSVADVEVEISSAKTRSIEDRYVAQVTLKVNGNMIRGEQSGADSYAAVDAVLDKIDRQVSRFKKSKRFAAYSKIPTEARPRSEERESARVEEEEEREGTLVRHKRFAMKPMSVEEALMNMQMLGHDFFVFFNSETDSVCVVYKRKDGDFGLIEPEPV